MGKMKLVLFITFIITCSLPIIQSDIPTHCYSHQIVGNWIFYQTKAEPKSLGDLYKMKCGIKDHTKVSDIAKPKIDKGQFTNSFEVNMDKNHKVTVTKSFNGFNAAKTGFWTMVYDEGFEINLGKKNSQDFSSYFTFLKFSKNNWTKENIKSKHYSHCYEALIGWFHIANKKWGCFYVHKLVDNYKEPTNGEADDKLLVVENVIKPAFIEKDVEIETRKKSYLENFEKGRFMQTEFNNKLNNKFNNKFLMKTRSMLTLSAEFTNHEEVVERINSMNLSWKAEAYSEFKG